MKKKEIITITIIAIILVISGFLGFTYYSDVTTLYNAEITINDIQIQELGLSFCKLKIIIDISNPSGKDISELTANFNIKISNNFVGKGSVSKISIPSKSSKEKEVIVTIYYANVAAAVVNGIADGNFDLTLVGEASGKVLFGLITVTDRFRTTKSYV